MRKGVSQPAKSPVLAHPHTRCTDGSYPVAKAILEGSGSNEFCLAVLAGSERVSARSGREVNLGRAVGDLAGT